ncbi:PRC-barrel domain protein [Methanobrevibacter filiformis]|uniref:PRC-barrel domain protein n=2 Tax=Methanobrevibacter filiformis TaxID=55758 RepID=A0A165ZQA8_9EURY|nr:PRC-barrel domain protein [Methanobrevibacter filiformis]
MCGFFMLIKENLIGKEVVNVEAMVIGKVVDVEFNLDSFEIEGLIIKKLGIFSDIISKDEIIIPFGIIKKIGDKIILKN